MTHASALYFGKVMHRRTRPKVHVLNYRVFWTLFDLDEIEALDRRLRFFSLDRFNLVSFHRKDHGDGSDTPLREQIEPWLEKAGVDIEGGAIRLLTMPRILGYVFNPISIYYCHHSDGRLLALVYEVTSTFGIRHSYVVPVCADDVAKGRFKQATGKALYVSPFMGMEMDYAFRGHVPSEVLDVSIDGLDAQGPLIHATMAARRVELTDRKLLSAFVRFPLLTLKVVAAIHWEALKLWLKGVGLTQQPAPASQPVTIQTAPVAGRLNP